MARMGGLWDVEIGHGDGWQWSWEKWTSPGGIQINLVRMIRSA